MIVITVMMITMRLESALGQMTMKTYKICLITVSEEDYGSSIISQVQADNEDAVFQMKCCHLIAMTQPEKDDQSISY